MRSRDQQAASEDALDTRHRAQQYVDNAAEDRLEDQIDVGKKTMYAQGQAAYEPDDVETRIVEELDDLQLDFKR